MAECGFEESVKENIVARTSVITGDSDYQRFLLYQLKMSIREAKRIDIIVSFLMESGVKLLIKDLQEALARGVAIRILTGNYLGITQPTALHILKRELGARVDLRFYNDSTRSFHPKAYIFHYEQGGEIFIGSSNISRSALTSGIEWNYRLIKSVDEDNFASFCQTFDNLFEHHSLVIDKAVLEDYSKNWHRPAVAKDLAKYEPEEAHTKVRLLYAPRGAQIEALYALEDTRAEGATKALVQAATGIGKTYLAAFDSRSFKRILFVAHREEILEQAQRSFANVRVGEEYASDTYGFFKGEEKATDKSLIFASVASLGKKEYLQEKYFAPDYFDYIVIDEFHHAVTKQYRNIVEYFKPRFLLGLTATPERLDGRDIYQLCDYNVPFEFSLQDGINKGMLSPFHYYGIFDETDYSGMKVLGGHYAEQDLNAAYLYNNKRYELIYKHYKKYKSRRALGFCCSREHAEAMAQSFVRYGIRAAAVYSGEAAAGLGDRCCQLGRARALAQLKQGELQVVFSVDMFNEGVDVPNVDMVMFLRPTESPVVFLQQLGRGLRTAKGEAYLTVLDFIGNYKLSGRAPYMLAGVAETDAKGHRRPVGSLTFPDDCLVDFDLELLDMFAELEKQKQTVMSLIRAEFYRVMELLGRVPNRVELMLQMEGSLYALSQANSTANIFKHYLQFLVDERLTAAPEQELCSNLCKEFLELLETTSMSRVYKMPVLSAFYNAGNIRTELTLAEVLASWRSFFANGTNWKDLPKVASKEDYELLTDKQHINNILSNPVNFLHQSSKGLLLKHYEKVGSVALEQVVISFSEELKQAVAGLDQAGLEALKQHMEDVISYRTLDYYRRRLKG